MSGDQSFLVEDFIDSITAQLDRVQDALRMKAVNRPLTYALKDLSLELKVFVEMDSQGKVRFRTGGPNESGASVVNLAFTTITKPMIEENTVTLAATRSPTLDEIGLAPDERQRLERVGVRTVAQLEKLGNSAGVRTVARLSDMSIDRLRGAIASSVPRVTNIAPAPAPAPVSTYTPPPAYTPPPVYTPPPSIAQPSTPPIKMGVYQPATPPVLAPRPVIRVGPGIRHLQLGGVNLVGDDGPASVTLNDQRLHTLHADDEQLTVSLPESLLSGALDVTLPGGNVVSYMLEVAPEHSDGDGWAPENGGGA